MIVNHSLVAGGAGFIGANLVAKLLSIGRKVTIIDNFSRGSTDYLVDLMEDPRCTIIDADLADRQATMQAFGSATCVGRIDDVWHLAANSDIPAGVVDVDVDFKDTFCTSLEIIRAMKEMDIKVLNFASSSAVYGDLGDIELSEDIGPLMPISNYGAMKLASEALANAAAEAFLSRVNIFRFPNVVGVPATHGVLLDFVRKLKDNPARLEVLGDGTQQKAYLHVTDLIDAMLHVSGHPSSRPKVLPINIGPIDTGVTVRWIAETVVSRVAHGAEIFYGTSNRGWVGDVPKFRYSTRRLQTLGWNPKLGSDAAITRAINEIAEQEGL